MMNEESEHKINKYQQHLFFFSCFFGRSVSSKVKQLCVRRTIARAQSSKILSK